MALRVGDGAFITVKASLAAAGAAAACHATGVTDVLSASFVAVLAVSPTLVTGLRRSAEQLVASAGAGLLATAWAISPGPAWWHVLGATGTSVGLAWLARLESTYITTAFCALYVVALPGRPLHTLEMRMASVALGGAAALVVNAMVTAPFYGRVFRKRMQRLEAAWARAQTGAQRQSELEAFEDAARVVRGELRDAMREARWRPGFPAEELAGYQQRVEGWLARALELRAALSGGEGRSP